MFQQQQGYTNSPSLQDQTYVGLGQFNTPGLAAAIKPAAVYETCTAQRERLRTINNVVSSLLSRLRGMHPEEAGSCAKSPEQPSLLAILADGNVELSILEKALQEIQNHIG